MTRITNNPLPSSFTQSPTTLPISTGRNSERSASYLAKDKPDTQSQHSYTEEFAQSDNLIRERILATSERRAKSDESPPSDVKQAIATTNAERGPGKKLTADQEKDFTEIYNLQQTMEGRSHEEATDFAADMLRPLNSKTLEEFKRKLPEIIIELDKADGKNLAEIVTDIHISQIGSLEGYLGELIKLQDPENSYGVMTLTAVKDLVGLTKSVAGAKPDMKDAVLFRELSGTLGKSFSQLMTMAGEGNIAVLGTLIEEVGKSYVAHVDPKSNTTQQAATHLRGFGNTTYQLGLSRGNKGMQASGQIMMASADFIGGLDKDIDELGNSSFRGVIGNGVTFTGRLTETIGLLSGDDKLATAGRQVTTASSLLIAEKDNGEKVDILSLISKNEFLTAGINFATVSANITGNLIGGETGETVTDISGIVRTGYSLFNQISNAIKNGTNIATDPNIVGLSYEGLVQIFNLAGIEIPPEANEIIQSAIAGLSSDAGTEALVLELTPLIMEYLIPESAEISAVAVSEALTAAGKIGGAAAIVYKVVELGFEISDIASRDDINDTTKAQLSLDAASKFLLTTGLVNIYNPAGWIMVAAAGVLNDVSAAISVYEDGFNRDNLIKIFGGPLGSALFPPKPPHTTLTTLDRQDLPSEFLEIISNAEPDENGVLVLTGGSKRAAFATIDSPFGYTYINMARMSRGLTGEAREERISVLKPMMGQVLATDQGLVDALNNADTNNGEIGLSMHAYRTNLADNPVSDKEDLDGADYLDMLDKRYEIIVDNLAASGSQAGQALKTWMDAIDKKVIDVSGDTYTAIQAFANNPSLLNIPPQIIERILNTVEPGSLKHVMDQLNTTVGTYLDVLTNPLIQSETPRNQFQSLDFTINHLNLIEAYAQARAPHVPTPPDLNEVITALDDIPQPVKDLANEMNVPGNSVQLLGLSENRGLYRMSINGQVNDYRYVEGDEPYFEKVQDETPYHIDNESELLERLTDLTQIDVFGNIPKEHGIDKNRLARGLNAALNIAKNPTLSIVTDPDQQASMDAQIADANYALEKVRLVEFAPETGIDNSKMGDLVDSIKENIFHVQDKTPYHVDTKPELLTRLRDLTQNIDVFDNIPKHYGIDKQRFIEGGKAALNIAANGGHILADTTNAEYFLDAAKLAEFKPETGITGLVALQFTGLIDNIKEELFV